MGRVWAAPPPMLRNSGPSNGLAHAIAAHMRERLPGAPNIQINVLAIYPRHTELWVPFGGFLHSTQRAHSARTAPIVSKLSHDHPENHPPPGELCPQGKNSTFRQQSSIFSGKDSLF